MPAARGGRVSEPIGFAPEVSGPHLRPIPPACSIFKTPHEAPLCEQGERIIGEVFRAGITFFAFFLSPASGKGESKSPPLRGMLLPTLPAVAKAAFASR